MKTGTVIDRRYTIEGKLGAGGMGAVYVARQAPVDRRVAIKVLRADLAEDEGAARRFVQEARAASALSHPNAVSIHDFGRTDDGLLYLAMELIDGRPLSALIAEECPLPAARACGFAAQLLEALHAAHSAGIVHRDLKPDNVLVTTHLGRRSFLKVLDFGLAKLAGADGGASALTQPGQVFGTPAYMSPEQAQAVPADHRADLYAVGCILYELLAGRRPFDAPQPLAILLKHVRQPPPPFESIEPPVEVPAPVQRVVFRALAKDRDARYDSAAEMVSDLESALEEAGLGAATGSGVYTGGITGAPAPGQTPSLELTRPVAPVALAGNAMLLLDHDGDAGAPADGLLVVHGGQTLPDTDGAFLFGAPEAAADFASAWLAAGGHRRAALHVDSRGTDLTTVRRALAVASEGQTLATAEAVAALGLEPDTAGGGRAAISLGHWHHRGADAPLELFELGVPGDVPPSPPRDTGRAWRVQRTADGWTPVRDPGGRLPRARDAFIGRAAELHALARRLEAGPALVTVVGMGGAGKTRLAIRCAHLWAPAWSGGAWFCDLSDARSRAGIAHAVAASLEVPLGGADPVERLARAIAGRGRCLLILDNFEQVAGEAAATLGRWMQHAPDAQFLVTSREVLGLPGEAVFPVAPLSPGDAMDLFDARARLADPGYSPDAGAVRGLVDRLDRLPLALELAAARARTMSPERMLARLDDRFRLLTAGRGRRGRQATLRATLDWSWALLSAAEQAALAQLSVFEGGFELDATEAVVEVCDAWSADLLQALVDRSLVRKLPADRFDLLASVCAYAAEKLGPEERAAAEARHGAHFAGLARGDAPDLENAVAACRRSVARGDGQVAAGAVASAWSILERTGPFGLGAELADSVIEMSSLPRGAQAVAFATAGAAARLRGQQVLACARLNEALEAAREIGDLAVESRALWELGTLADLERPGAGRGPLEKAVGIARAGGDARGELDAVNALGVSCFYQGLGSEATRHYEAALVIARALGDRRYEGRLLGNLANVRQELGETDAARALYEEALVSTRSASDRATEAQHLSNLGLLEEVTGRLDRALDRYREAVAVAATLGAPLTHGVALTNLGAVHRLRGAVEAGRRASAEALAILRDAGHRTQQAVAMVTLALLDSDAGRGPAARSLATDAVEIASTTPYLHAYALQALARVTLAIGDAFGARVAVDSARALGQGGQVGALIAAVDAKVCIAEGRTQTARVAIADATAEPRLCQPGSEVAALLDGLRGRTA